MQPRSVLAVFAVIALFVAGGAVADPADARRSPHKAMWGPATVDGVSQFPIYKDLGVTIYQEGLSWRNVATRRPREPKNPSDPAYEWPAELDRAVAEARRYKMRVMLLVIGAPGWSNKQRAFNFAPTRAADYADFMTAAARRYPGVNLWEIWGEPSRKPNFAPLTPVKPGRPLNAKQASAPRRYARLLDAAYSALKRNSPRNLVIGGNTYTTGDISTRQWIRHMRLPSGRPPRMDLYGHNPFSFRRPDLRNPQSPVGVIDFSDLGRLAVRVNRELAPKGKRIRLYLSEFTLPTFDDPEFNFHVSLRTQASWIRSATRVVRTLRPTPRASRTVYSFGWIHLRDIPDVTGGGLLFSDGRKKPGYFAFKAG